MAERQIEMLARVTALEFALANLLALLGVVSPLAHHGLDIRVCGIGYNTASLRR